MSVIPLPFGPFFQKPSKHKFFYEDSEQVKKTVLDFSKFVCTDVLLPIAVGMVSGSLLLNSCVVLLVGVKQCSFRVLRFNLIRSMKGFGSLSEIFICAVKEDILRNWVQGMTKKSFEKILPNQSLKIFSREVKIATLISIIVPAIFTLLASFFYGRAAISILLVVMIYEICLGILSEKVGLLSSIAASVALYHV